MGLTIIVMGMTGIQRSSDRVFVTPLPIEEARARLWRRTMALGVSPSAMQQDPELVVWGLPPFSVRTYRVQLVELSDGTGLVVRPTETRAAVVGPMVFAALIALYFGTSHYSRARVLDSTTSERILAFGQVAALGAGVMLGWFLIGFAIIWILDRPRRALARTLDAVPAPDPISVLSQVGPLVSQPHPAKTQQERLKAAAASFGIAVIGFLVTSLVVLNDERIGWGKGPIGQNFGIAMFGALSMFALLLGITQLLAEDDPRRAIAGHLASLIVIAACLLWFGVFFELVFIDSSE